MADRQMNVEEMTLWWINIQEYRKRGRNVKIEWNGQALILQTEKYKDREKYQKLTVDENKFSAWQ